MCHEQKPYYTENTDKFKHYVRLVYTIASKFTINTDYEHLIPDEFIASTMCHNQHGRYFSRSSSAPFVCPGLLDPALWQNALQMILKVSDLLSLDDTVLPAKPPSVKNQLDWGLNCAGEFFALTWCMVRVIIIIVIILFKSGNMARKHKQETYRQTDRQYK